MKKFSLDKEFVDMIISEKFGNNPLRKGIYELSVNERIYLNDGIYVMRVPGGFIYEYQKPAANILNTFFVKYSNDCKKKYFKDKKALEKKIHAYVKSIEKKRCTPFSVSALKDYIGGFDKAPF